MTSEPDPPTAVFGANPRRTAVRIAVVVVLSFVTFRWILIPMRAEGISMQPAYQSGRCTWSTGSRSRLTVRGAAT